MIHPFPPNEVPNFLHGLSPDRLGKSAAALSETKDIGLMDAGAYCNGKCQVTLFSGNVETMLISLFSTLLPALPARLRCCLGPRC